MLLWSDALMLRCFGAPYALLLLSALHSLLSALCSLLSALCSLLSALCTLLSALSWSVHNPINPITQPQLEAENCEREALLSTHERLNSVRRSADKLALSIYRLVKSAPIYTEHANASALAPKAVTFRRSVSGETGQKPRRYVRCFTNDVGNAIQSTHICFIDAWGFEGSLSNALQLEGN
jgi:hypothetical protein